MDYTWIDENGQLGFGETGEFLRLPSRLFGFHNTQTTEETAKSGRRVTLYQGELDITDKERVCECGCKMHIHSKTNIVLRHLCHGSDLGQVTFPHVQFCCPKCGATKMQHIPFKAPGHRITLPLYQYTMDLLAAGFTNKAVAEITGLGKNTVKAIDKKRLEEKYTIEIDSGGRVLRMPEEQARVLSIDEFSLHKGHKYATHIIDIETGHILWIARGKKKQVVYDFIDHVGMKWMEGVEAVACDMNSDFQEAFESRCEWITIVFDRFHIVKNFNEKVADAVRKDEQTRLLKDNELFFIIDLIKEKLSVAYALEDEVEMAKEISGIMDICQATSNKHFLWFARLLDNHFEGIIAHATYNNSSGKIEGINNKIKTLRRQGYGYPDDDYFFLKLVDISRKTYVRNPVSHRICD